ncbi:MAG: hypothetical protein ACRENI_09865 [Gemmatimonadaceae bacterium]
MRYQSIPLPTARSLALSRFLIPLAAITLLAQAPSAGAQETAVRFQLAGVADSTFSFQIGQHYWIQSGQRGIVVDPRQRDVLVGRFRIIDVTGGLASALITGQTTNLSTQHVALLELPRTPWYRSRTFWAGTALGAVLGLLAGSM